MSMSPMTPRTAALRLTPVVLLAFSLAASAAERRPVAEILPADAMLVMAVRDGSQIEDVLLGKSPFFSEPKMKQLLEDVEMSPRHVAEGFEKETGFALSEILESCEGPAGVAFSAGADGLVDTADDVGIALVGVKDAPSTAELWKRAKERIAEARKDEIVRARDDDFEGADVWALTVRATAGDSSSSAEKRPDTEEFFALHGGQFLFTNSREWLERSIRAINGKDVPTLAGKADWKAGVDRLGAAVDYVIGFDAAPLMATLRKEQLTPEISGARLSKALGIDDFRGMYAGWRVGADAMEIRSFVHVPSPRTGLAKLLSPADSALEPDRFATADVLAASVTNFSFAELVAEIERILGEVAPQQAAMVPMVLGMIQQQTQVDLKKDFIDLLTPPIYSISTAPAQPGGDPQQLIYLRSNDAKKALDSLKKLVTGGAQGVASLEESEYLGHKIASLKLDMEVGLEDADESVAVPQLAFAATDTHLFVATNGKAAIEDALRGIGKEGRPLTATDEWKRATAGLSPDRWNVGFGRMGPQWQPMIERMADMADLLDNPGLDVLASLDPAVMAKYFDLAGYEMHSDSAGIVMNVRILPPAAAPISTSPR